MATPNIYDFATSELSQDATLAYILSWAKPDHRERNPGLNRLGEQLLRALVRVSAEAKGIPDPLHDADIKRLDVGTQRDHVDVWAEINGDILLIIEDKTETCEHDHQIERYECRAGERRTTDGKPWNEMAVYVKTGNECQPPSDEGSPRGLFWRPDLLAVLGIVPNTGNTIIEEFRHHLQRWQDDTNSFRNTPCNKWSPRAIQGYYLELSRWLNDRTQGQASQNPCDVGWGYVPNPSGGFLGFWWHWRPFPPQRCKLYLQIENALRLQIRAGDAQDEAGAKIKVLPDLLWAVFSAVEDVAGQDRFRQIRIRKSGRYRGGSFASVADVLFGDNRDTYIVTDDRGFLDLHATQERIVQATNLVDSVCSKAEQRNV